MDIERELGITLPAGKAEIRRAYARRLKETHPEDDPQGFQRLRQAYEAALDFAQHAAEYEPREPVERPAETDGAADSPRVTISAAAAAADGDVPDAQVEREQAAEIDTDRAALADLLRELAHRLDRGDEAGAVDALDKALDGALLSKLNVRRRFELLLLEAIAERDPLPWAMTKAAIAAFHWDAQYTSLPGEYQHLADRLLTVPLTEERLAELRQQASKAFTRDFDKTAAKRLLGPYRPLWFDLTAGADLLDAMDRLLRELRIEYPTILENEVDPRVLAWWTDATRNSKARIDKRSRRFTWTIVFVSLVSGMARVLLNNS